MIYILDDNASEEFVTLKGETHKYLIKVRRHKVDDELYFRNKKDLEILYKYKIVAVDARSLSIQLISSQHKVVKSAKSLHLAWCMIDVKSIEKVLPSLSEIGVEKISFIACDRTQRNFKLDFKRFQRILEASMQQSGRSNYIEFDTYNNLENFLKEFPDTKVFDFCDKTLKDDADFKRVLVGCEGGFSPSERELLKGYEVFRLDTPMVLRSESAVVAISSKILF